MASFLENELELLMSSYDPKEFTHFVSNQSQYLKFTLPGGDIVSFETQQSYPQSPPHISLATSNFSNAEKAVLEHEIRGYASSLVGSPMIMDLVHKLDEILKDHKDHQTVITETPDFHNHADDDYMAVIHIDHMRKRNRYVKTLSTWASDMDISGVLVLCQKWIFLILQGSKKYVKNFIVQFKTTNIDVDSTGKPCKEKRAKVLFEGKNTKCFSSFSLEEFASLKDMEEYLCHINLKETFQKIMKPLII